MNFQLSHCFDCFVAKHSCRRPKILALTTVTHEVSPIFQCEAVNSEFSSVADETYIAKQHFKGDFVDIELAVRVPLILIRSGKKY